MGYPAKTSQERAGKRRRKGAGNPCRENGTPNINWSKWPVDVVNDTKRHSPETSSTLLLVPCGHFDHMARTVAAPFNVFKLSTLTLSVLQLTSTWHFAKPRWNLVSAAFRYLANSRNVLWYVDKMSRYHLTVTHRFWLVVILTINQTKGGCLWQRNNGNAKIRTLWWNILLTEPPVCAESNVNTAARSSTPKPGTENIAASRLAVTRCWICGKALKSALSEESIPALAAGSSSYRFGQMPDIAAMPVGRKATASVKQSHTLLF